MLEKKEKPIGISRREFLMGTAATTAVATTVATAAAVGIAGLKVVPTQAKRETITGWGNITVTGPAESTPLEPPYVELLTRIGAVTYKGIIEGSGTLESRFLRDTSLLPSAMFNPLITIHRLDDAKVAGTKGNLVIMIKGTAVGDPTSPEGTRNFSNHLEIISGSGGLGSIRGHGLTLTRSWSGGAYSTYWVELSFDASE